MNWTSGVHKRVLPNGLTILVRRDPSAPVVAVVTHVRAGYFDEPDEWVGISHVLEHMFFKGTVRRGPGEIARDTQLLGGYLNAATIYDKTVYYTVLPSSGNGLARALDVQADALMHTALDAGELARELEVIIQEAKRKLDTPPAVTRETLYELLFPTHRMRRWRIGTEAGLRGLTRADLVSYYESRYTPDRTIVAIAGHLDPAVALDLAADVYGGWTRDPAAVAGAPPETEAVNPVVRVMTGDVARPLAAVGWRTVGTLHEDAAALDVAASLLGTGRGSRLYRAVRLPGLASSAHAIHYTPTEVGVFDITLESDNGRLDEAIERSLELATSLGRDGPAPSELERVRAMLATRWARQFESMDGRAGALCDGEALGDYALVDELYQRLLTVTAERVQQAAADHLEPQSACVVIYLPEGGKTRLANDGWPVRLSEATVVLPPVALVAQNAASRATPPADELVQYAGGVQRLSLAGVDLLVRPKPGSGLVSLLLHVPGLPAAETEHTAGVSRLFARSTVRGAAGMSAEQLAQAAESLGGGIGTVASVDGIGWSITVRAEALEEAARLLRSVALDPALAADDIAIERALQASDARRIRDDMYQYPFQRVLQEAFKGDPYGLPRLGEPEVLENISDQVVRDRVALLGSHRAVVVAVGDLHADLLLDGLAPLTSWPARAVPDRASVAPPGFGSGRDSEQREKAQSALAMAFPAFAYRSPARYAIAVAATLLSGLAGRLFMELRDKMSLAYTVAAIPWLRHRTGAMIGYIATSPEREEEARQTMLRELRRLTEEPITQPELERARNYAAGLVEIRQQSGASVASEILTAWLNGVLEELADVPERLRSVGVDEVARVARQVFDPEARAEFVVRGRGRNGGTAERR
jgi:zinc protease